MKRVLFKRILFPYLILAPLLIISLELYLSSVIKDNYISKLKESLTIQAYLIAEQIPSSFTNNLDDFSRRYKEKKGARETTIMAQGLFWGTLMSLQRRWKTTQTDLRSEMLRLVMSGALSGSVR